MNGIYIIILRIQQRKIYVYININLLKTNAAIWLNKVCRTKQLTPTYIRTKERL